MPGFRLEGSTACVGVLNSIYYNFTVDLRLLTVFCDARFSDLAALNNLISLQSASVCQPFFRPYNCSLGFLISVKHVYQVT